MRNRDEIIKHLSYYSDKAPSECGLRCAELLEHWMGLHHIDRESLKRVDFTNPSWVEVTVYGNLATFDFDGLTFLVLLAHALKIRAEVAKAQRGKVTITLHPRQDTGSMSIRHPGLSDLKRRCDDLLHLTCPSDIHPAFTP